MHKVKITVLRRTLQKDLAEEYGIEGLGACPLLQEGQVFYADYARPDGLCDEAWKAIYQYVFALAHGVKELFYYKDWIRLPHVPRYARHCHGYLFFFHFCLLSLLYKNLCLFL